MPLLHNQILETIEKIRNNPLDFNLRLSLIQYYCLAHQWEKAKKALQQYLKLNPSDQQTQTLFTGNIECELTRLNVFNRQQQFLPYSQENHVVHLQQNILDHLEHPEGLDEHFFALCDQYPTQIKIKDYQQAETEGTFIDTDIRLSHVFEIFQEANYYCISFDEIEAIHFKPTEILTDLIWRRGEVLFKNKQKIPCFMPVRYPLLQDAAEIDDAVLYARTTEWQNVGHFSLAMGQKTFTNADVDKGILDISDLYCV